MVKRNTKQKELIKNFLEENKDLHFKIEDIENKINKSNKNVGKTTIYRIVKELIKEGYMLKIPIGNKQGFCYKYIKKSGNKQNNYHHLICEKCGVLTHFKSQKSEELKDEIYNNINFNVKNNDFVIYGICKVCNGIKK